ncbi:hypothetical protein [Streptomyces europaeiscabiei]|uniref:hypothetical protein n=1 Tax=Streptomyces europaeiscabiei TaxID=146819 RepID=UPI0038F7847A
MRAVEKAVTAFLPAAVPGRPVPRVCGRLQRRLAAVLARHVDVEQTDAGGLAFGTRPGPYGYATPRPARTTRPRRPSTSTASARTS